MTPTLETPAAMRARLRGTLTKTVGGHILSPDGPISKRITQPCIPTQSLAHHIGDIRTWYQQWREEEARHSGLILATTKKSSGGLRLTLPSSLTFPNLAAYGTWLGTSTEISTAQDRIHRLIEMDGRLHAMAPTWHDLANITEPVFGAFLALVRWRRDHPDSRPPVRSLAIPGMDTKWVERNKALVASAFRAIDAYDEDAPSVLERMGFDTCDRMTVWFRCGEGIGGIAHLAPQFALRPSETNPAQFIGARRAIIVENQTSFEGLDLRPDDIAVFGQGAQAPAAMGLMPWLGRLPRLLYWGDMDAEGYHILARVRAICPSVQSILMDAIHAQDHMAKLSHPVAPDTRPSPHGLTPQEADGYDLLAAPGRRIEQEHLPWHLVNAALAEDPTRTRET